jgi:septal ring-binding cell division protein DamX
MASARKRGAGDRVLESRHVIGLFLLMLVFSAVFFTLGYVMGRSQYDGQVAAATSPPHVTPAEIPPAGKTAPSVKHPVKAPPVAPEEPGAASGWDLNSKPKESEEHLKVAAAPAVAPASAPKNSPEATARPAGNSEGTKTVEASGAYTLQVTAVRRESDALDLAKRLQKKKFPAFVLAPQGNQYYRVQVGPYADLKSAEVAKKGLEGAGFRAIVKRG